MWRVMPLKMKAGPCNVVQSGWGATLISPVLLVWHVNKVSMSVILSIAVSPVKISKIRFFGQSVTKLVIYCLFL